MVIEERARQKKMGTGPKKEKKKDKKENKKTKTLDPPKLKVICCLNIHVLIIVINIPWFC